MQNYPPSPMPGSRGEAQGMPSRPEEPQGMPPLDGYRFGPEDAHRHRHSRHEHAHRHRDKTAPATLAQQWVLADISFAFFLCVSGPTTLLSISLGSDLDVAFFIGRVGLLGCLIPVFVALLHILHLRQIQRGRPRMSIFFTYIIGTSLSGAYLGRVHYQSGKDLFIHLQSGECTGSRGRTEKVDLQNAWMHAYHAWQKCHDRLVEGNGGVEFPNQILLQHCQEWTSLVEAATPMRNGTGTLEAAELARRKLELQQFGYLADMENAHSCTGFCTGGPFLWTQQLLEGRNSIVAACSPAVAVHFRTVEIKGKLLYSYNFMLLAAGLVLYVIAQPTLAKWGYEGAMLNPHYYSLGPVQSTF